MSNQEIWLTPEQAAVLSNRSMIAVRALIETTLENEGTRHLLQVFKNSDDNYEAGYLLHRSLVTSEGLQSVRQSDVVEQLSSRIQELEAENEVLRFRSATVRHDAPITSAQIVSQPTVSFSPTPMPSPEKQKSQTGSSGVMFWVVLGLIFVVTIAAVLFILIKQGFVQIPVK
jgi:hypothetical protein